VTEAPIPFAPQNERPAEEVAGGFIPVRLGGQDFNLNVLSIRHNREWTRAFARTMEEIVTGVGNPESMEAVAVAVAANAETIMDQLIAYDASSVLPDREWIDTHATDREVYEAMKLVTAAAFPKGMDLMQLALLQISVKVRTMARTSSTPTSSSPPNTGGRRKRSKAA
jgi:hypothetical protein